MDGERHDKDGGPTRPYPEKGPLTDDQDPDPTLLKGEIDSRGRVRVTAETHGGTAGADQPGTKSGETRYGHLPARSATEDPGTVDPNRLFQTGDEPAQDTPGVAADNRAALAFLHQQLEHLRAAGTSEDIVRQLTGVYSAASHLVQGPAEWEPALWAEFEAWVPYEISSGVPEYQRAKETVLAAGETVHESARLWFAENGSYAPIAGNPHFAAPLLGIGAGIRAAITEAIEKVQAENVNALQLVHQAVADLAGTTDPELVVRYAGTVFAMVDNLLHGAAMGPATADEEQAWAVLSPTEAVANAVREHLVPVAEAFGQQAQQMADWYPFHSLMTWDAPVTELIAAGQRARGVGSP